jgi:type I restriction enzyme R subunit
MDEDPSFYAKFSALLEETIREYRARRLSERDYLSSVMDLAQKVASKDRGRRVPDGLRGNDDGQAFFGVLESKLVLKDGTTLDEADTAQVALDLIGIVRAHHIVDIWSNEVAQNRMRNAIDDYFFDVLRDQRGVALDVEILDTLELDLMKLARARFPG